MFAWVSGVLGCLRGIHERSERHIRRAGSDKSYVSRCRFCGTPMRRRAKRDWVVIPRSERR